MKAPAKHLNHIEIAWGLLIISVFISFYFLPSLPNEIAVHWNPDTGADFFLPKLWGALILPFCGFILITAIIRLITSHYRQDEIRHMAKYAEIFLILLALLFYYLNLIALNWNIVQIPTANFIISPAIAAISWYAASIIQAHNSTRQSISEQRGRKYASAYLRLASIFALASLTSSNYFLSIVGLSVLLACAAGAFHSFHIAKESRRLNKAKRAK